MSDARAQVNAQPGDLVIKARWRKWSRRTWRRVLSFSLIIAVFGCIIVPMLMTVALGFRIPPSWLVTATEIYEYQVTQRLLLSSSIMLMAIIGITWLLGVVGAVSGASVLGGGTRSLGHRLMISRRRLAVVTGIAVWLRVGLLAIIALAIIYAYTHYLGPQVRSGMPQEIRTFFGRNLIGFGLAGLTTLIWLIGPILRMRYSVALGALAATFTRGRTERVAYALGGRFGMELLGTLLGLWGGSGIVLIILSIVDPSTYQTNFAMPNQPFRVAGIPIQLFIIEAFAVLYALGQIILSIVYQRWAIQRMRGKQKAASDAAKKSREFEVVSASGLSADSSSR